MRTNREARCADPSAFCRRAEVPRESAVARVKSPRLDELLNPWSRGLRRRRQQAGRHLEGSKGVPRNGGCEWQLVRSCFTLSSLHVQTLMLTDVQTLGTPLVSLKKAGSWAEGRRCFARAGRWLGKVHPIFLPRLSLLRFVDSTFPGNSLWTWEFHPLNLRFCLSQTLWNPES